MSYAIITVVYGVPITHEVSKKMDEWETNEDPRWDDYAGWKVLYSASGPYTFGYCGVKLDRLKHYEPQLVGDLNLAPTKEQEKEAEDLIAKLEPELRELAGPVGVYFIWSDS